jgi:hypothetical protein
MRRRPQLHDMGALLWSSPGPKGNRYLSFTLALCGTEVFKAERQRSLTHGTGRLRDCNGVPLFDRSWPATLLARPM